MDKMPDLYQVKWRKSGTRKWNYGLVDRFGSEVEQAWKKAQAIWVSDAITPNGEWVYYGRDEVVSIPFSSDYDKENGCMKDEYSQYVNKERKKANEKSAKATGLVGKMFSVGVADGAAYYVVVKENKKSLKIEWRGFCPDRYTDAMMQWGGSFPKDRIEQLIRRQEGMAALFSKTGGITV